MCKSETFYYTHYDFVCNIFPPWVGQPWMQNRQLFLHSCHKQLLLQYLLCNIFRCENWPKNPEVQMAFIGIWTMAAHTGQNVSRSKHGRGFMLHMPGLFSFYEWLSCVLHNVEMQWLWRLLVQHISVRAGKFRWQENSAEAWQCLQNDRLESK